MFNRILVALDGSEGSKKAANFAIDLARATGAKLVLLSVLEQPTLVPFGPLDAYAFGHKEADRQVGEIRTMLDSISHDLPADRVERRVEFGIPADVICEQAEKIGVDLVVIGSRGHTPTQRLLLGSVSDRVVHHARVPVTVVR